MQLKIQILVEISQNLLKTGQVLDISLISPQLSISTQHINIYHENLTYLVSCWIVVRIDGGRRHVPSGNNKKLTNSNIDLEQSSIAESKPATIKVYQSQWRGGPIQIWVARSLLIEVQLK